MKRRGRLMRLLYAMPELTLAAFFLMLAFVLGAYFQWQSDRVFYIGHPAKPQTMTLREVQQ